MPDVAFNGHNINNQGYADDTVLMATSKMELLKMIDTVVFECERIIHSLNNGKTDVIVI